MGFKLKPLHGVDSYKLGHRQAYPAKTSEVYSNFTPRSVKHLNVPAEYKTNDIVWFGAQAVVKDMVELWDEEFFRKDIEDVIDEYAKRIAPFVGPNEYTMDHIRELHKLGYLPLEVKTLPEGSRVPVGVPVLTTKNISEYASEMYWLTNYLESYLSAELWKMSTTATIADYYRKIITKWAILTGGSLEFIDFQGHDFSYRGMSGTIDSAKSGSGHLLSFKGTDVISAVDYLAYHYAGDDTFVGASVPAMEHSIQCSYNDDLEYFRHIVKDVYPNGIVSVVCDGYDYWSVLTDVLPALKDEILSRGTDSLGLSKVVVRPDSGDPVRIVAGYRDTEVYSTDSGKYGVLGNDDFITEEEVKGSIQVLWDTFGGTVNDKGYKTLNQKIGLIYGDSITLERCDEILKRLEAKGFASDNIVFGIGSYTYQMVTRDTLGFAMKATNEVVDGVEIPLFKDPKTDKDKTKKSAKGLLCVYEESVNGSDYTYKLKSDVTREDEAGEYNSLTTLYKDGRFHKFETLVEIRDRLAK